MAGAKLNEADAARLARHYGKSTSEFAAVVGADATEAANRLGLDPDGLSEALKQSALSERARVDNEETRRAAARRDANALGSNQIEKETLAPPSPETLDDGTPVDQASDTQKKTAKKTTKKAAAKKTAAKKTTAKKTAKKTSRSTGRQRSAAKR